MVLLFISTRGDDGDNDDWYGCGGGWVMVGLWVGLVKFSGLTIFPRSLPWEKISAQRVTDHLLSVLRAYQGKTCNNVSIRRMYSI